MKKFVILVTYIVCYFNNYSAKMPLNSEKGGGV
jgi:hypothetical protein